MQAWQDLYPYASHFISLQNWGTALNQHYVQSGGPAAAGKPVVLCVHGNPTWSFTYRSLLAGAGDIARVVAIDHIGCGLSDKPQDYNYCLEQHISNLCECVQKLDLQRITLVVHDWGGAIGLGAALRLQDRVERLLVLNTAAFPPPYVPLRIAACRIPLLGNWAMRGLNVFARAALRMAIDRLDRLPPAVEAGLLAPYGSWRERVGIARFVQDIPGNRTHSTWQVLAAIEEQLPQLARLPCAIVWGMKDWCFRPECLTRFEQLLPAARVNRLQDVGHYVMEEAPDEVLQALRSLLANN